MFERAVRTCRRSVIDRIDLLLLWELVRAPELSYCLQVVVVVDDSLELDRRRLDTGVVLSSIVGVVSGEEW